MSKETRRRQMREMLKAKAKRIIEADEERRLETVKRFSESARAIKGSYSPERRMAQLRELFGDKRRKATIEK